MHHHETKAFAHQMLILSLTVICFSGSAGLATVWMRNQISRLANGAQDAQQELAGLERRLATTDAEIASAQDPAVLKRLNTAWQLGLVPPDAQHVVHVNEDPVQRLAGKHDRGVYRDTDVARVTFRAVSSLQ